MSRTPGTKVSGCGPEADHDQIDAVTEGRHSDPFSFLGLHLAGDCLVARTFIEGADQVSAFTLRDEPVGDLSQIHKPGFFAGNVTLKSSQPLKYCARNSNGDQWWLTDTYSFGPVLGEQDDYYIGEGSHRQLYNRMGSHPMRHQGVDGVHFSVWAPEAFRVSVVGDFNSWDGRRHAMRKRVDTGIWEIFVPGEAAGLKYKFELLDSDQVLLPLKADPYARAAELRPATASVVVGDLSHVWADSAHREFWKNADARRQPVSVYEVHAGSWKKPGDGEFLSWDELADTLIPYVVDMGFTHIEFLPISEFPYDPSWGYQTTGLYAPTARFGPPEAFARFIDGAHKAGIGVILDWVPAHFPTDKHGLAEFDGTHLYEHADPRQGFHPDWNTAIYNFGRKEVAGFLVNNALYWADKFHVDGLRVDAVASMLYLDYSRKDGEWIPNKDGGRENLEAVEFLRNMNTAIYDAHPGIMTIAEESTSWPQVSQPVHTGGLGFGFKWNMGFMHDTLKYMSLDPLHRKHNHNELTFGLLYAFSENFVLALSHDEVVHGKGSLIEKMAGQGAEKFSGLRAYYAFMWGYPGKKLLFMGQEFAQGREWSEERELDWHQTDLSAHRGVQNLIRDLNALYRNMPAMHGRDCEPEGFEWLIPDDSNNSVYAWLRKSPGEMPVVVISNFTPVERREYKVPLPYEGRWRLILNTDAENYDGTGTSPAPFTDAATDGGNISGTLTLPPLSTLWLEYSPTAPEQKNNK